MKKQVLITVIVAIFAFIIGYRADKTYDVKRESIESNDTSSSIETNISSSKQETTKPSSSSQSSSSSKVELSPELEQRFGATFRNTKWGDSRETVKKYEKEELQGTEDILVAYTNIYGNNYILGYDFKDNKLVRATYLMEEEHMTGGQYILAYDKVKEKMIEIYGEPNEDKIVPLVKQSQIDLAGSSSALEYGYVVYQTIWETSSTEIIMYMESKNFDIKFGIRYQDINYKDNPKDSGL